MAVVVSETTEEIDAALQDVRTRRHMRKGFEFKFARINEPGKIAFIERIAQTSFMGVVVIYDKNAMDPPWAWGKNDALLAQLLMRALLQLPRAAIENAKMIIDGDAEAKKLGGMVRPLLSRDAAARGIDYRIAKIVSGRFQGACDVTSRRHDRRRRGRCLGARGTRHAAVAPSARQSDHRRDHAGHGKTRYVTPPPGGRTAPSIGGAVRSGKKGSPLFSPSCAAAAHKL